MTASRNGSSVPVTFRVLDVDNVNHLKSFNLGLFPIKYQDKAYQDCLACGDVSQLAYHKDELVGAIGCRLEQTVGGCACLYIMTLAVQAPYRRMGIGRRLLDRSLGACADDPNITHAYLHVQTSNEEAIQFYTAAGFESVEVVRNYYRRLDPPDALHLRKQLRPHGVTEHRIPVQ